MDEGHRGRAREPEQRPEPEGVIGDPPAFEQLDAQVVNEIDEREDRTAAQKG
ncbi:hypothetical protein [Streptosporangium sp. 'caverna']|uniref:hypothetical protein n=1 Tax=Streptosporangium sp. 'caverna' TaxID=2202249 RepID=UPI001955102C|nr:hypothetical protein [Streptosporangium sp. 'caverna']